MGRGEVALIGRWLDAVDREEAKELPVVADGILIGAQDVAAVAFHLFRERAGISRGFLVGKRRPGSHAGVFAAALGTPIPTARCYFDRALI